MAGNQVKQYLNFDKKNTLFKSFVFRRVNKKCENNVYKQMRCLPFGAVIDKKQGILRGGKKMIKKAIILSFVLMFVFAFSSVVYAKTICKFTDFLEASDIAVSGNKIFVSADNAIYFYSLKDMKLIKKFGRKGEGPEEFKYKPSIKIYNNKIFALGDRLKILSLNGDFIKLIKFKRNIFDVAILGENYILREMASVSSKNKKPSLVVRIGIYDKNEKLIKELSKIENKNMSKIELPPSRIMFEIYKNNIFLADARKGLYVCVYDKTGKKLYEINKDYEKEKVTDAYKKRDSEKMKKKFKKVWAFIKDRYYYQKYFPAFSRFYIFNGKLYFKTYKTAGDKVLFKIFDIKGNKIKEIFLPDQEIFTINDGIYYYLKRDENDVWVLYSEKIF